MIEAVVALLNKMSSEKVAKEAQTIIVPCAIEFLQHGFRGSLRHAGSRLTSLQSAFVDLWKSVATKLAGLYSDQLVTEAGMKALSPLLVVTLEHAEKRVADAAVALWNTTVGDQPWADLSGDLGKIAARLHKTRPDFRLPGEAKEAAGGASGSATATAVSPTTITSPSVAASAAVSSAVTGGAERRGKAAAKRRTFLKRGDGAKAPIRRAQTSSSSPVSSPRKRKVCAHALRIVSPSARVCLGDVRVYFVKPSRHVSPSHSSACDPFGMPHTTRPTTAHTT